MTKEKKNKAFLAKEGNFLKIVTFPKKFSLQDINYDYFHAFGKKEQLRFDSYLQNIDRVITDLFMQFNTI